MPGTALASSGVSVGSVVPAGAPWPVEFDQRRYRWRRDCGAGRAGRVAEHHEHRFLRCQIEGHDRLPPFDPVGYRRRAPGIGMPQFWHPPGHTETRLGTFGAIATVDDVIDFAFPQRPVREQQLGVRRRLCIVEVGHDRDAA